MFLKERFQFHCNVTEVNAALYKIITWNKTISFRLTLQNRNLIFDKTILFLEYTSASTDQGQGFLSAVQGFVIFSATLIFQTGLSVKQLSRSYSLLWISILNLKVKWGQPGHLTHCFQKAILYLLWETSWVNYFTPAKQQIQLFC